MGLLMYYKCIEKIKKFFHVYYDTKSIVNKVEPPKKKKNDNPDKQLEKSSVEKYKKNLLSFYN